MLTVYGEDLLNKTKDQCAIETFMTYAFHRLHEYFKIDPFELVRREPMKTVFEEQRLGRFRPEAPVFVDHNRYDPLVPYVSSRQMALDWCAQGADVEFWTNEQPPFLNKLVVNHGLAYFMDGERGMAWVADRFNGLPTTPNCGHF